MAATEARDSGMALQMASLFSQFPFLVRALVHYISLIVMFQTLGIKAVCLL